MKKLLFCLVFSVTFLPCFSQTGKSEFVLIKSIFGTEKTNYVQTHMALNENDGKIFWPIYEDYEIDRAKFSGKRWEVLQKYAANYSSISRSDAKDLIGDLLNYQKKELKLKKKYFNLLSSKLSPVKASHFIQLEEYINSRVKYAILGELPFVQP